MNQEIDLHRELAELCLEDLARTRRALREGQGRRDVATADAKAALTAAELPFVTELDELAENEALTKESAEEAIVAFEAARRAVLSSGSECARVAMPAGVSVKWLEGPRVVDPSEVPEDLWEIDTKKLKARFKDDKMIPGVEVERKPSFVVAEVQP